MKTKTHFWMKEGVHFPAMIISTIFNVLLFISLSDTIIYQVLFGTIAVVYEVMKLYLLLNGKKEWKHKNYFKAIFLNFVIYLGLAIVSLVAAGGFALMIIQEKDEIQSQETEVTNIDLELINIELEELQYNIDNVKTQIESKIASQADLPPEYVTSSDRYTKEQIEPLQIQLADLQEQRLEKLKEKANIQKEVLIITKEQSSNSVDMFKLIGDAIGIEDNGRTVMIILLFSITFLLEVAIAITSDVIEEEVNLEVLTPKFEEQRQALVDEIKITFTDKQRQEYLQYVEALFYNVENGKRLNPNSKIMEIVDLDLQTCTEIRKNLSTWEFEKDGMGTPLLSSKPGGTYPNFDKDKMLKIVKFYLRVPQAIKA